MVYFDSTIGTFFSGSSMCPTTTKDGNSSSSHETPGPENRGACGVLLPRHQATPWALADHHHFAISSINQLSIFSTLHLHLLIACTSVNNLSTTIGLSTMPPGKKRKTASNGPEDNGERSPPEFVCKCEDLEESKHKHAIQCECHRRISVHKNIASR